LFASKALFVFLQCAPQIVSLQFYHFQFFASNAPLKLFASKASLQLLPSNAPLKLFASKALFVFLQCAPQIVRLQFYHFQFFPSNEPLKLFASNASFPTCLILMHPINSLLVMLSPPIACF
jgi:hypothetical protein